MIVLDTNVLSELMRPRPSEQVATWLKAVSNEPLAVTAITVAEIEYGISRLPEGARQRDLRQRFGVLRAAVTVLPLDEAAATYAGAFRAEREGMGLPTTPSDMMIAGIVMQNSGSFATRNSRDFAYLPIKVIDPWADEYR